MKSRRSALSLIELTMVILVMGLLAAVTAPRMADSLRATKLEAAARQLAAHVDYVRSIAVNEGRSVSLICDNTLATYASDSADFPERIGQPLQVNLARDYDPAFTLEAHFDSQSTLSFDLEGVPRVQGVPLVQGSILLSGGDVQFIVIVMPGTGETRVERFSAESESPAGSDSQESSSTPNGYSGAST